MKTNLLAVFTGIKSIFIRVIIRNKGKGKGKVLPRTGYEDPEGGADV